MVIHEEKFGKILNKSRKKTINKLVNISKFLFPSFGNEGDGILLSDGEVYHQTSSLLME